MKLAKLGYTANWIKFKLLDETLFNAQLEEFEADKDEHTAHFRYNTFMKWFASKETISNREIDNFLLLAHEDEDQLMAGNAATKLFTSALISKEQFEILKIKLAEFGDWTTKLITRETLMRRLIDEELTFELYAECLEYKMKFDDNRLLVMIINQTDDLKILTDFTTNGSGKRMRTLADKKLTKINRESK